MKWIPYYYITNNAEVDRVADAHSFPQGEYQARKQLQRTFIHSSFWCPYRKPVEKHNTAVLFSPAPKQKIKGAVKINLNVYLFERTLLLQQIGRYEGHETKE